jgi:predicted enzyme related to lactoylglutathione lyase
MANRVVYFEVGAADDRALVEFYRELFGGSP